MPPTPHKPIIDTAPQRSSGKSLIAIVANSLLAGGMAAMPQMLTASLLCHTLMRRLQLEDLLLPDTAVHNNAIDPFVAVLSTKDAHLGARAVSDELSRMNKSTECMAFLLWTVGVEHMAEGDGSEYWRVTDYGAPDCLASLQLQHPAHDLNKHVRFKEIGRRASEISSLTQDALRALIARLIANEQQPPPSPSTNQP
jgi:hypothetical protein